MGHCYETPYIPDGLKSIWAQYTLKTRGAADCDALQARAGKAGVPTAIYYPVPLHWQQAYRDSPGDPAGLTVSDDLANRVVSLPMHSYLSASDQALIIEAVLPGAAVLADAERPAASV